MLKQLIKFLRILNGDVSPGQIAAGLSFGMFLAFTPLFSLHNVFVLLLVCILRVNITAVLIGLALFSLIAWFIDPWFIATGEYILTKAEWIPLWTQLYQQDIWRLAHFNNTLTMGSVVVSAALWLPLFLISRFLIIRYRTQVMAWVIQLRIVRWLKTSKFFQMVSSGYDMVEGR